MDNLTRILDTYNSKFNSSANILQKVLEDFAFQICNALDDELIYIEKCARSGEYSDYEIAEKIKKLRENIY